MKKGICTKGKRLKYDSLELKEFIYQFCMANDCKLNTFSYLLEKMEIKLPVKLQNFNQDESSFMTSYGEKITIEQDIDRIHVLNQNGIERVYFVEDFSRDYIQVLLIVIQKLF